MSVYRTIGPTLVSTCPVNMNMFAWFDKIPLMAFQDIKVTKLHGWTDRQTFSYFGTKEAMSIIPNLF